MEFDKIKELVLAGKRIPDEAWKTLTVEQKKEISMLRKKGTNDWRWYAISEQIAKDFSSFPYNVMQGLDLKLNVTTYVTDSSGSVSRLHTVARSKAMGVGIIDYFNTPGYADQRTSGINMAATQLYTAVRRKNSGAKNYEAADLMMYILAMREVYAEILEDRRILGLAGLYALENHYLPDLLIKSLGIKTDDLQENLAVYRGRLNLLITKANALAVPKYFTAFNRADFICSNLFADSTSIRGQFYMFKREYRYTYSATASTSGTALIATPTENMNSNITFAARLTALENMLDALFLDDDVNTMSGDIMKAFGYDALYTISEINEDYVVQPLFDENILAQIENCVINGGVGFEGGPTPPVAINVTQQNQLITFMPTSSVFTSTGEIPVLDSVVFNSHKDEPSYTDNLDWSRLITAGTKQLDNYIVYDSFGLEFVIRLTICKYLPGTDTLSSYTFSQVAVEDAQDLPYAALSEFDWHPLVYIPEGSISVQNGRFVIFGDLKKYTVLDVDTVRNIHNAAVTAAFWSDELYRITGGNNG